jgi:hypothetical protein
MSYDCATYTSEAAANAGALRNWINYVIESVAAGDTAKKPDGTLVTDLGGLTDQEIGGLALLGHKGEELITENGSTVAYVAPQKAYELDLWFYPLPPTEIMDGVVDCTVQPYNPAWETPE